MIVSALQASDVHRVMTIVIFPVYCSVMLQYINGKIKKVLREVGGVVAEP